LSVGNAVPVSPAWQSITPPKPSPNRSRPSPSPQPRRQASLDTGPPMSPLGPERFEPTTTHGLHSRNLSLFFPQPGAPGDPATSLYRSPEEVQEAVMPEGKKVFGGAGDWKFGSSRFDDGTSTVETPEGAKRSKRRGHHVGSTHCISLDTANRGPD